MACAVTIMLYGSRRWGSNGSGPRLSNAVGGEGTDGCPLPRRPIYVVFGLVLAAPCHITEVGLLIRVVGRMHRRLGGRTQGRWTQCDRAVGRAVGWAVGGTADEEA